VRGHCRELRDVKEVDKGTSVPLPLACSHWLSARVTGFPGNAQEPALNLQPSFAETGRPPNTLPNQIPLPDPKTCQDLLHTAPSLAPLPEHPSSVALGAALEEVGRPTEAHALQLQLVRMRGKDTAETLIRPSGPDMHSIRVFGIHITLLLCSLLLSPMDATLYENKTNVLHLSSSSGAWPLSSEPCAALLPQSLPGFTHMAPLPKFLVGLPLIIALEETGCHADVWALKLQLYWPGRYKNYTFSSIIFKDSIKTETQGWECQWMPWPLLCSCWPWGSQAQKGPNAPSLSRTIVQMLPGIGIYYNLGTALYYAAQNCLDKAKEQGQDGGKAGTPPAETSKEGLGGTSDVSGWEETTLAPLVSDVGCSAPSW
ncbi:LOW QUALITY PROTEIN: hypothetical protein MC885_017306, partial [Smutsia gigantea]